jgi:cytoskeletal protein RodZ
MLNTSFQLRTIGSLLKERRKERKLTVSQISEITKIRGEYLKAIEDGNYDVFPSEVYLKGFLKNYAKFLGINTERALAMYRRERDFRKAEPTISMSKRLIDKSLDLTITPSRVIIVAVIIAALLTVLYIGSYVGKILKEPNLKVTAPIDLSSGQEDTLKVKENKILIQGEIEVGATLSINGQEFQTNNFQKFTEGFDLEPGLNKFTLIAESQFGKKTQVVLNVVRDDGTTPQVAGDQTTPTPTVVALGMSGKLEIVNRDAYVEVTIDGDNKASKVLSLGSTLEFSGAKIIKIFTPRPDAIKMTINGKDDTAKSTTTTWEIIGDKIKKN